LAKLAWQRREPGVLSWALYFFGELQLDGSEIHAMFQKFCCFGFPAARFRRGNRARILLPPRGFSLIGPFVVAGALQ